MHPISCHCMIDMVWIFSIELKFTRCNNKVRNLVIDIYIYIYIWSINGVGLNLVYPKAIMSNEHLTAGLCILFAVWSVSPSVGRSVGRLIGWLVGLLAGIPSSALVDPDNKVYGANLEPTWGRQDVFIRYYCILEIAYACLGVCACVSCVQVCFVNSNYWHFLRRCMKTNYYASLISSWILTNRKENLQPLLAGCQVTAQWPCEIRMKFRTYNFQANSVISS